MAEVTSELMFELLKKLHPKLDIRLCQRELRADNKRCARTLHALQGDVNNLRATLGHLKAVRSDRQSSGTARVPGSPDKV